MPTPPADVVSVRPARDVAGSVRVPGDKSISHRYALLAALAEGTSHIGGFSTGADCAATVACLRALGVAIRQDSGGPLVIEGRGFRGLARPASTLNAANSGTTMRLLAGVVAGRPFRTVLDGDSSLVRRPMRRLVAPLVEMGARIDARDGRPPLIIDGAPLHGITHRPEIPSAQVKSALLLAGLQADGTTIVCEPAATRDHTERALEAFGVRLVRVGDDVSVAGGQPLAAREVTVPGDISSAAFWMALAAGLPGSDLVVEGVGLNPTRTAVLDILRRAGAALEVAIDGEHHGEPVGRIHVGPGTPRGFAIEPHEVPAVIDEIPALAALAALLPAGERLQVDGAGELRVKESDRIACLAAGMRAFGATVEEFPDGFQLTAGPLRGATVDAAGDHRLAMAFAVVACGAPQPSIIQGASSAAVSYPDFFGDLGRLASTGDGR